MKFDLCFKGGGALGLAYLGAIEELLSQGHSFRRLVGTSAGAITAALLAAGLTTQRLRAASTARVKGKPVFHTFFDAKWWAKAPFLKLIRLERRGGIHPAAAMKRWLINQEFLLSRTFLVFSHSVGSNPYLPSLTVSACDLTAHRIIYLNSLTAPHMPVTEAVRCSVSIPGVFTEQVWDRKWGRYRGKDMTGHRLVDGGLVANMPLRLLTSSDAEVQAVMGKEDPDAFPNLALDLDKDTAAPGLTLARPYKPLLRTTKRVLDIVETAMGASDRFDASGHEHEVCTIPVGGVGVLEFDLSSHKMEALLQAGRIAMRGHLAGRGCGVVHSEKI